MGGVVAVADLDHDAVHLRIGRPGGADQGRVGRFVVEDVAGTFGERVVVGREVLVGLTAKVQRDAAHGTVEERRRVDRPGKTEDAA